MPGFSVRRLAPGPNMREATHSICRSLVAGIAKGDADAMMSFVDIVGVVEKDIAVSVLAELQRQARARAWQGFASALEPHSSSRSPSMVSKAIDGAFEMRMIALLEREQGAARDSRTAVSMSPALRTALDRYARFKAIEARQKVRGYRPTSRSGVRPAPGENRIGQLHRAFGNQAFDRLKSWLARMRDRGR